MFYIIGDIHGSIKNIVKLITKIKNDITADDMIIFLGDYIDRGNSSFEVIEFLLKLKLRFNIVFLKGNHEDMFIKYLSGKLLKKTYYENGGMSTLKSYMENGYDNIIPEQHKKFYNNLQLYYETDEFIAVHAGLNPNINIGDQAEESILWIRDKFYNSMHSFDKTVIFGHTPVTVFGKEMKEVFFDRKKNIIGIDTGAVYGGVLTCLRMPDKKIYQA